jgi:hypothetical protein
MMLACARMNRQVLDIERFSITIKCIKPEVEMCSFKFVARPGVREPREIEFFFSYEHCGPEGISLKSRKVPADAPVQYGTLTENLTATGFMDTAGVKDMKLGDFVRKYQFDNEDKKVPKSFEMLHSWGPPAQHMFIKDILSH